MSQPQNLQQTFAGVLLGTAVGDALGLPAENLSPERIRRRWKGEWRMRLAFGRGMISDDTEHTLTVAQALLAQPNEPALFQRALAWKFRWWFASLPGGVGLATAKACLKLWMGFPASKAAVKSAGSGPAMRSAIIGAYFANAMEKRRAFVLASSQLTHRSWQAETAAMAVAECVALAVRIGRQPETTHVLKILRELSNKNEWQLWISRMETSLASNASVSDFVRAAELRAGVTGYALHVVPVAIYAWLRHPMDFRAAMIGALECGGDTDTVGAVLGALVGAAVGEEAIPHEWRDRICEWPRSVSFMRRVAAKLATQSETRKSQGAVPYFWPGIILRNIVFLTIILLHGFRRLAPPY